MSGHNKWSKIKNKKAVTDAQKSKIFSKLARLITVESKISGGDINSPGLRAAIEKAKRENMPSGNIDRAVKKGVGGDSGQMEQVVYEAYGPGGCAIIIEGLTDNKNRISAEIKHILSKNGLSLAAQGSATWAFEKTNEGWEPKTMAPISAQDKEKLEKIIEEFDENDDVQNVYTNAE
jgi:YebC/PmpR family DNA-binding regulatory protein